MTALSYHLTCPSFMCSNDTSCALLLCSFVLLSIAGEACDFACTQAFVVANIAATLPGLHPEYAAPHEARRRIPRLFSWQSCGYFCHDERLGTRKSPRFSSQRQYLKTGRLYITLTYSKIPTSLLEQTMSSCLCRLALPHYINVFTIECPFQL